MSEFSVQFRVYLEDTDAGGIVYYVNYLKYMERARTDWLRSLGWEFQNLYQDNLQFVVHSMEARYIQPARMDDDITVTVSIEKMARTYLIFRQAVLRGKEQLCEANIKVVCIHAKSMKPVNLPKSMREQWQRPSGV